LSSLKRRIKMWMKHYKLDEHEQKLLDMSREEFDKYMMENYPDQFKKRRVEEGQQVIYPMNFGFEIGKGWRHVLDSLCGKLKIIQDLTGYVCVFDQVKEKYGGARFYAHTELMEGHEESPDTKQIDEIIDTLVNHYESYCDYVCEELGTNIHPDEKIVVGGWYYGMALEGFKKSAKEAWPESFEKRIEMAEKCAAKQEQLKKIKRNLYELSDNELKKVQEVVEELMQEPQKG